MAHDLVNHDDNPFKVNGQTFGVEQHRTVIPNGPTAVSFSLLERSDSGGWEQLDTWKLGDIKDETGLDWDSREKYEEISVRYIQSVAEEFYA